MPSDTEAPARVRTVSKSRDVPLRTTPQRKGVPRQVFRIRRNAERRRRSEKLPDFFAETRELPEPGWLSGQASGRYGTLAAAR